MTALTFCARRREVGSRTSVDMRENLSKLAVASVIGFSTLLAGIAYLLTVPDAAEIFYRRTSWLNDLLSPRLAIAVGGIGLAISLLVLVSESRRRPGVRRPVAASTVLGLLVSVNMIFSPVYLAEQEKVLGEVAPPETPNASVKAQGESTKKARRKSDSQTDPEPDRGEAQILATSGSGAEASSTESGLPVTSSASDTSTGGCTCPPVKSAPPPATPTTTPVQSQTTESSRTVIVEEDGWGEEDWEEEEGGEEAWGEPEEEEWVEFR